MSKIALSLVGTAALALLATSASAAVGAKYGSREPHACASRKAPGSGPITAAEAKQYLQCDEEKEVASVTGGSKLYLVTNVSVEVGAPRRFMMGSDDTGNNVSDGIDPHFSVYPIRGGMTQWSCSQIGPFAPAGKNCIKQEMPRAKGICFQSSFREWHCHMQDISQEMQSNQPAPKTD